MNVSGAPAKVGVLLDMRDEAGGSPMSPPARAFELRFEEALANGEIDRPVELVTRIADGLPSGTAESVVQAYEELAAEGVLAILGPGIADNSIIAAGLADKHGIPTLNFPGTERSRGVFAFHFQLGSLPDEGPMIVAELVKRGHASVAVIRDHGVIGGEYFDYFDQACIRTGLLIAADTRVSPVAVNLDAAVARAKASGASALVYLGFGLVVPALTQALSTAGWAPPRFMNTAFLHGYMNPAALTALEGWVGVDMVDLDNPVTLGFIERFERRFGERMINPISSCFYDMATMAVEGLRWAPSLTRDGVRRGMERAHQLPSANGGRGTVMGFAPWDHAAYKGPDWLLFQQVRNGRYEPYRKA